MREHKPIFVGGLDRSGKTPMRLALSAHPNIAMSRRTYMWINFYDRYGDLGRRENFERCLASMLRHTSLRMLEPDAERIRREFPQGDPTYANLFALFHAHYAERAGKPRWGDQLGYIERYADPIFAAYPGARMIHMLRDPRDQIAAATPLAGRGGGKIGAAVARWLSSAALAARNQQRYPGRYKVVRFETLVAQREATLHTICAFVGESFVPEMVTLDGAMRFGAERDDRDDPSAEASAPLSTREIAFIERQAGRVMAVWDYRPRLAPLASREQLAYALIDWPFNVTRAAAWRAAQVLEYRMLPRIGLRPAFGSAR